MTPEPLILRPSRSRTWGLVLISAGFVGIGLLMARSGDQMGLWGAGFFGLCLLIGVVNALPSASHLRLDREGFEVRSLFRSRTYRWAEVESFGIGSVPGKTLVTITLLARTRTRALNSLLAGDFDGALPETYGLSPAALVALLEDWRSGRPRMAPDAEGFPWAMVHAVARGGGGLLVLKIAALFSFCGGPLFFCDLLDAKHRGDYLFAILFAPVGLLLLGALALRDEHTDGFGTWSIWGGLAATVVLTAMNAYAAVHLVGGPPRPDGTLMKLGLVTGLCAAAWYGWAAANFLRDRAR